MDINYRGFFRYGPGDGNPVLFCFPGDIERSGF